LIIVPLCHTRAPNGKPTAPPIPFHNDLSAPHPISPGTLPRVIQEPIKRPLAEERLFGKRANGRTVLVDTDKEEDKLRFAFPETGTKAGGAKGKKGAKSSRVPKTGERA
jgi:hypothetical protein